MLRALRWLRFRGEEDEESARARTPQTTSSTTPTQKATIHKPIHQPPLPNHIIGKLLFHRIESIPPPVHQGDVVATIKLS
jgi:hypothetical protein